MNGQRSGLLPDIPRVPHVPPPVVDLRALPILRQVEAIRGLRPLVAIRAHRHALAMVFRDSSDAFCRGFDLILDGAPC